MGRDKAALMLGGISFLQRVAEALRPVGGRVRVVGGDPAAAARLGLEQQPDLVPGLGPLAGLQAALATASRSRVVIVACDLPLVSTSFLRGLLAYLTTESDAAVPREGDPVPVCAAYRNHPRVITAIERRIDAGRLSASELLEDLCVRWVAGNELRTLDPDGRCLLNVNTPEDYERAKSLYSSIERDG